MEVVSIGEDVEFFRDRQSALHCLLEERVGAEEFEELLGELSA